MKVFSNVNDLFDDDFMNDDSMIADVIMIDETSFSFSLNSCVERSFSKFADIESSYCFFC